MSVSKIQLGKNKVTDNFIETLKSNFEKHKYVRISVLKSAGHTKQIVNEYKEEILKKLPGNYRASVIGFTIVLRRLKRA